MEEGNTALIGCKLPKSSPKAQVRFRVRGKWLEQSTGEFLCPLAYWELLQVCILTDNTS